MKLYLSSFKIGDQGKALRQLFAQTGKPVGYIPNALDFSGADRKKVREHMDADMHLLKELEIDAEVLDLRAFFSKQAGLQQKLETLGGLWISGGNVFVLRQAMKLSGLDATLTGRLMKTDFVYAGYSAAGCVLSPRLDAYQIVDDATDTPYEGCEEVIWEGLGLIDFAFLPHFDSDHPESGDIGKEVQYCLEHHIPYKTLRDGEVLILDTTSKAGTW